MYKTNINEYTPGYLRPNNALTAPFTVNIKGVPFSIAFYPFSNQGVLTPFCALLVHDHDEAWHVLSQRTPLWDNFFEEIPEMKNPISHIRSIFRQFNAAIAMYLEDNLGIERETAWDEVMRIMQDKTTIEGIVLTLNA